jgi:hypothetical protein
VTGSAAVITSTAKLHADPSTDAVLFAYAQAHRALVREIYRRHVVGDEQDWTKIEAALRERGWTRREARSAKSLADAAQEAAVESAKLDLDNTTHALAKAQERLARSKKVRDGAQHGRARRVQRLQAKKTRLERDLEAGRVRVCFSSRKLFRAQHHLEENGFATHDERAETWRRRRASQVYVEGDRDGTFPNRHFEIVLSEDHEHDLLVMRVPPFLRQMAGGQEKVSIPVSGFRHGREHLGLAMLPDVSDHEARLAAFREGRPFGRSKKPALHEPAPRLRAPITVRVYFSEDKRSWYVAATTERVGAPAPMEHLPGALGMDTNPDHLAWCLVDKQGNPTRWGKIPLALTADHNHDAAVIGDAVKELVAFAKSFGAPLATEKLDFTRKRTELRYLPKKLARLLSSFAYSKILTGVHARSTEEGVRHIPVNPAWTSVLGQANYAVPHGVSVDQAAACVIARRGLGLPNRVRPQVTRWMRPVDRSGPRACSRANVSLRALAGALPKRRATWDAAWLGRKAEPGLAGEADLPRCGSRAHAPPVGKGCTADPSPTRRGQAGVIRPYRSHAGCAATPAAAGAAQATSVGPLALDASVGLASEVPVAKLGQRE